MIVQLKAVLAKNLLEKRRSLRVTTWEFMSHMIMITLLVISHRLAGRVPYKDRDYSRMDIKVPPSMSDAMNTMEGPLPSLTIGEFVSVARSLQQTNLGDYVAVFGSQFDNILRLGTIHIVPQDLMPKKLVMFLRMNYPELRSISFQYHQDEHAAIKYITSHLKRRTLALIVLNSVTTTDVRYKIRMNYTTLPNTNMMLNPFAVGLGTEYQLYITSGFLSIKDAIDKWVFNYLFLNATMDFTHYSPSGNASMTISTPCSRPGRVYYTPYPVPAYEQNTFYLSISYALGIALTSTFRSILFI
jgi:hypothetical protein